MARDKKTIRENYLDLVPEKNPQYKYDVCSGKVTIFVENKGIFNRAAQLLMKKPKVSQIHLDEMGDFIWPHIDGKNTVYDIAMLVKKEFGDRAEPLYNRLVQYMRNLESYGFIRINRE